MKALWLHLVDLAWLAPLLPLLVSAYAGIALLAGRRRDDACEGPLAGLMVWGMGAASALLAALLAGALRWGWPETVPGPLWLAAGDWSVRLSFLLDALSLPVALLVAVSGGLVARFSQHYLHRESGYHRFFMLLGVFLGGMQLLVLAGNALLTFVGWELCGIASFLLIGYAWQRPVATGHALFAFVTNRIGDTALLFGLGLAVAWVGSVAWADLLAPGQLSRVDARILALGFVLAALVKSAQLPFTPWLARAIEGPTPSSAIFYGAILVHAGVFLLLRLFPLLVQVPDLLLALVMVGALTAAYAWLVGLVQTDIKSSLIFATVFQVGLMVLSIGLGWTTLATVHLCLHAAWRLGHFLRSPSWLQVVTSRPAAPPAWLARQQWLYTAALQRGWLDRLAEILLLLPTLGFAQDIRRLESRFIDRMIGEVGQGKAIAPGRPLVTADGVPGRTLAALSALCQRLEDRLLLRGRGGLAEQALRQLGAYLRTLEGLLEQPRYLMMAVMATFVVIL